MRRWVRPSDIGLQRTTPRLLALVRADLLLMLTRWDRGEPLTRHRGAQTIMQRLDCNKLCSYERMYERVVDSWAHPKFANFREFEQPPFLLSKFHSRGGEVTAGSKPQDQMHMGAKNVGQLQSRSKVTHAIG